MLNVNDLKKIFVERGKISGAITQVINSVLSWDSIPDKPTEFPPEDHSHVAEDITDLNEGLVGTKEVDETSIADDKILVYKTSSGKYELESKPSGSGAQNNFSATTAPTVDDDSGEGYSVGSVWIDVSADKIYQCVDSTTGAAVWKIVSTDGLIGTKEVDETSIADDKILVYKTSSGKYELEDKPAVGASVNFATVSTIADLMALTPNCSDVAYCSATKLYYIYAGNNWFYLDDPNAKVENLFGEVFHISADEIKNVIDGCSLFGEIKDLSGYGSKIKPLNAYLPYNSSAVYEESIVNGLPVIRFAGSTSCNLGIINKVFGNASSSDLTIFAVAKYSGGTTGGILSTRPSASTGWTFRYANSTSLAYFNLGGTPTITSSSFTNQFNICVLRRSGLSIEIGTQGGLSSPASISSFAANTTEWLTQIGAESHGASSLLNGDIAEIFIFDSAITGTDYDDIIDYLETKYSIS